ncbi:TraR/DksA family transcriptional regulator [Streptomyces laurentii]|uniref:TraR/DksA family transcriptional regulator n=1 Tax=Streptomyces laurentii TaxID=39478 RepID=UPI00368A8411
MVAKKTAAEKTAPPAGKATVRKATAETAAEDAGEAAGKAAAEAAGAAPAKAAAKTAKTAKKTVAKKAAAKKTVAKKAAAKKTVAKKTAASEAPAKKSTARRTASKKAPAPQAASEQTGVRKVPAKKTAGVATKVGADAAVPPARAGELAVRPGEDPWTPEEVAEARSELQSEVLRLRSELIHSKEELTGLMRDGGEGAGDDQADTGSKNITREHELALAANAREMLEQSEHALERLDTGTYGLCEVCGKPIGKARMQAFPRATLCVEDKQKQERRG